MLMRNLINITLFVLMPGLTMYIWGPIVALTVLVLGGATLLALGGAAYVRRAVPQAGWAPGEDTGLAADFPEETLDCSLASLAGLRRELALGMVASADEDRTVGELLGLEPGLR
jgi:hypothetical protein